MFSCGTTNTAIALTELVKGLGHTATLINHSGAHTWWDDCTNMKRLFSSTTLIDALASEQVFDLIFEIGNFTLKADERKKLTKKSVWIIRKPFVLGETESTIYPVSPIQRVLDGISETWLLTHVTSPDDVSALEILTRKPVHILPFLWSPLIAEVHHRSVGGTPWKGDSTNKLSIHMVDTNTTSSSSSTLPLVIIREAVRQKVPIDSWKLHNGELLAKSKFFNDNILRHCSDLDVSGVCVGRQRCVEWTLSPNTVGMAHIRFRGLRPVLLDLTWCGIPVIHNSAALRDLKCGLDKLYYTDNSVIEGVNALQNIHSMLETWGDTLNNRREAMLKAWAPVSPPIKENWAFHIDRVCPPLQIQNLPRPTKVKDAYTILFCDMWEGFKADYNFFTLLLNSVGKKVIGVSPETLSGAPNLVIFGPFGNTWTRYPGIPKVHFTGENTNPIGHADIQLNLGFKHYDMIKNEYMRFPLWLTEIDWFQADTSRLVNPKPIPLELCTRTNEMTFSQRSKFCSFIVSNPNNAIRNQSFHWLNSYKPVDSGGALYNTIGNELSALPGGGGGELKKTKFMMDYKFALTYENSSSAGYTTEKYLHAKASGAVPIYWGDPKFERDFNLDGCIDARNVKTPDELIALVKACESEEMWKKRASVPALDDYQVELARRTLAELAKRIYTILSIDTNGFPTSIGAKKGSNEAKVGMDAFLYSTVAASAPATPIVDVPLQTPLIVTYVTFKFLGSLQHWLTAAKNQVRVLPDMKALVFVGPDVPESSITALKETYTFAEFEYVPSDWTPPDFSDFWEPTHFAWKIWIYNTIVHRESLKGKLILYMDAGAILVRWPQRWLRIATREGISCLEDPREENERWCGDSFCERLSVTDSERTSKQIVAGIMCFIGGHPVASAFFSEAFTYAKERDTIVGPRLSGVSVDGKSYGHRQDQSILSVLVRRHPIPLEPLDTVYCDHSMRRTFQSGKCIYVHRGDFKKTIPFLPGIEDAYVINLDRRADRLEAFTKAHPELEGRVNRQPAYDGKTLTLTPELATLFKPNDFFWKKAVMGCAMSHLSLWWKLVNEHPDIHNYLIFEDDAQLKPGWEEILEKSMAHVPEDYDVLYLGGILPPNRDAFQTVLEPVTKYYSRVKPHSVFGQNPPSTYFHSCAYAYILSRKGAVKILNMMEQKKGYWTSADHMMCSPCDTMNLYFLTPVIAGCFQDSDPAYANSEFNNFSRVDSFDSDLWNNDERFPVPPSFLTDNFSIKSLLTSIYNSGTNVNSTEARVGPIKYTGPTVINIEGNHMQTRFLTLDKQKIDFNKLYEGNWLCNLFGIKTVCTETFDENTPAPADCPVVIMMRPFTADISKILWNWSKMGAQFKILHLSDELSGSDLSDSLEVYSASGCKSVLRTYIRDDFPQGSESKIQIIPIGYHWSPLMGKGNPLTDTPAPPFREFHWSFYGTDWNGRQSNMKPLLEAKLISTYNFYSEWNDPNNLSETQYKNILLQSAFVPCPDGMNPDTFRVYEALEAGCIPLIVHTEANDVWFRWISNYIPLLDIKSWDNAVRNMVQLLSKPEMLEIYRTQILKGWITWSAKLKMQTQVWLLS